MHHKRLKVEASHLPRTVINAAATNFTIPTTPRAAARTAEGAGGSRPEDKIQAILDRHGRSFCEEMGVRISFNAGHC